MLRFIALNLFHAISAKKDFTENSRRLNWLLSISVPQVASTNLKGRERLSFVSCVAGRYIKVRSL